MASLPETIGDYKVIRELGRGAMGVVYLAVHPSLGREMALKVMARDLANDPEFVERFRREGEAAAKLRHPNIVQVFDFAHRDGAYFIAMEYLGADTLKDLLQNQGQQSVERSCQMMDELLSALSMAHGKGIVHRDIKPANVMLTDDGPVALTDFSVAHMKESSKLTQTGAIVGTPEYMAPEQFDGLWDARSDLYAAGIVFYELLTGLSPFRSNTMTEVMRKQLLNVPDPPCEVDFTVPEAVSRVVSRSLEKEPEQRYQSAQEMREAIQAALMASKRVESESDTEIGKPVMETLATFEAVAAPTKAVDEVVETARTTRRERRGARRGMSVASVAVALALLWGLTHRDTPSDPAVQPNARALVASTPARPNRSQRPLVKVDVPSAEKPAPLAASAKTPAFPKEGFIAPGLGVGDVQLGTGKLKVSELWGPTTRGLRFTSVTGWNYGGTGQDTPCTVYFNQKNVVMMIAVRTPAYFIAGAPNCRVGASYATISSYFSSPYPYNPNQLVDRNQGIAFLFSNGKCVSIYVYTKGRDLSELRIH